MSYHFRVLHTGRFVIRGETLDYNAGGREYEAPNGTIVEFRTVRSRPCLLPGMPLI